MSLELEVRNLNAIHFWSWVALRSHELIQLLTEHPERQFEIAEEWKHIQAEIAERNP